MKVEASEPALEFDARMEAVTRSIDLYHGYLEQYLNAMTKNHADTDDLLSKLWVYVLHKFKADEIGNLSRLRLKARQLFIDLYRQRQRDRIQPVETLPEPGQHHAGKEAYSDSEEMAFKERLWSEYPVDMPERQKEALWLFARYGYTYAQISDKLDAPQSTVGDWIKRGQEEMARYLNDPTRN